MTIADRRDGDDASAALREHWDKVYAEKAEDQVSWYQARPGTSLRLVSSAGAGADARIVDVGGGASRLVDHLLDAGFRRVTVLDIAERALEKARQRLGERASLVEWVAADVTAWSPAVPYDVWHDRAVFHFLVRAEDRQAYRATLSRALAPRGHVIIGTFALDGPEACSGLPVMRHSPETLSVELGPGFQLVERVVEDHLTPAGKVQRFQFSRFVRA